MFNTFIRIRTLVKLESATPAVDQPFVEVDGKEVDKGVRFHFSTLVWSHSCHASSFIKLIQQQIALQEKRNIYTMKYSYTMNRGNSVPKD